MCICNGSRGTDCDYCQGRGYIVPKEKVCKNQAKSINISPKIINTTTENDASVKDFQMSLLKVKKVKQDIFEIKRKLGDKDKVLNDIEISILKEKVREVSSSLTEILDCRISDEVRSIIHDISLELLVLKKTINDSFYNKPSTNKKTPIYRLPAKKVLSMSDALDNLKKRFNSKR